MDELKEEIEEPQITHSVDPTIEQAVKDEPEAGNQFYIILAITIGIFIVLIVGFKFYGTITGAPVLTLDELHNQNVQGTLESENAYVYNGLSFVNIDGLWYTEIQRDNKLVQSTLHYSPKELENFSVTGELDKSFQKEEMHITFNPITNTKFTTLAASELANNVAVGIGFKPIISCDKNETIECADRPIVTCESRDKAVLYLDQSEPGPRIEFDRNCVRLIGQELNLVQAVDRFLYMWYRVMD